MTKFCTECGGSLGSDAAFCGSCGVQARQPEPMSPIEPDSQSISSAGIGLSGPWACVAAVGLLMILALAVWMNKPDGGTPGSSVVIASTDTDSNQEPAASGYIDPNATNNNSSQSNDLASNSQENPDCNGFVDGSSRTNALAGVVLGDSLKKVREQFRCGELTFDLEEYEAIISGKDYALLYEGHSIRFFSGQNGNESVELNFIGVPGSERLVSITRKGEYDEESGPLVDALVKSITTKYKNAKILETNVGYASSTRVGFGWTADGRELKDHNTIGNCSSRMGMGVTNCGTTLYAMIDPNMKRNPKLVKSYEIAMFDMSKYNAAFKYTTDQLQSIQNQRMKKEVETAREVKGI